MSTVIRVEHLSKQYRLGMIGGATLREDLSRWWALRRGKEDPLAKVGSDGHQPGRIGERFWALKDISFEVRQGEILGIIGRNGAGKSTLLKILSRITAPTEGIVKIKGRIGSLLEVGTGFHPELTGRENIYLNGAILGMSRREVDRKLDEIIAFSECEQFIDTPVKRYSSGMYVRLAFAVAAHLDPEILIVDEVLAVGDAAFQKKCLGKMSDVAGEGRTVLFVSHNMASVALLCSEAMLIQAGRIVQTGQPEDVIGGYVGPGTSTGPVVDLRHHPSRTEISEPLFIRGEVTDETGRPTALVRLGTTFRLRFTVRTPPDYDRIEIGLGVSRLTGERVFSLSTRMTGDGFRPNGTHAIVECTMPDLRLLPGSYVVKAVAGTAEREVDTIEEALRFDVVDPESVARGLHGGFGRKGVIWQPAHWAWKSENGSISKH